MPLSRAEKQQQEKLETRLKAEADLAQALRPLRESEVWQALIKSFSNAREQVMKAHLNALLKGKELDQRQLDYDRGHWDGVLNVLSAPERAFTQLEQTLERIQTLERKERGGDS